MLRNGEHLRLESSAVNELYEPPRRLYSAEHFLSYFGRRIHHSGSEICANMFSILWASCSTEYTAFGVQKPSKFISESGSKSCLVVRIRHGNHRRISWPPKDCKIVKQIITVTDPLSPYKEIFNSYHLLQVHGPI